MELVERPNIDAVRYLKSITFDAYKEASINDADKNGETAPKMSDIKAWYNNIQFFCKLNLKTKGNTKRIYSYSQSTPAGMGGRLFCGNSLQGIWGLYRGLLMRGIGTDIDMNNCHPVILRYVCGLHDIPCPNLEYYVNHRDEILSGFTNRAYGKKLFLTAINNNKRTYGKDLPDSFRLFDKEIKDIQRQLLNIEEYKPLRETIPAYKQKYNFTGSLLNRVMCYYENIILGHAIHIINQHNIEIAILMFDGLMVYGDHYNNTDLLTEIEQYVDSQMNGLYMKWSYKEHNDELHIPEDWTPPDDDDYGIVIVTDDEQASNIIYEKLKKVFKSYKGRLFFKFENIWITDNMKIDDYILTFIMGCCLYKEGTGKDKNLISYCQNVRNAKNVREALYAKIRTLNDDPNLYQKFHTTTKNRICFKDGVLDFKMNKFYLWEEIDFEYYSCLMIDRPFADYFNNPDMQCIDDIKSKIFDNMYGDKTDLALRFLSRAITGNYEDKNWATYMGNRDCGKGVQYDIAKCAFGDYVNTFELGNILYNRKTSGMENLDCSKKLYWLMDLEFIRLAVSQETPDSSAELKASGKMIKKMAGGGDTLVARRNYDRMDTYFTIDSTFYVMGNTNLETDCEDCNEHRLEFQSVRQFKTAEEIEMMRTSGVDERVLSRYRVKDPTIKDLCKTEAWANAFVFLMVNYYSETPISVIKPADEIDDETLNGNINKIYDITNNEKDFLLCNDVYLALKSWGDKKKIELELKQLNVFKKECNVRGPLRKKVCFFGIKERVNDDDCEDYDEQKE